MANYTFTPTIPATGNNPSSDQPNMQVNNQSTNDIISIDHITFNVNNGGQHKQITFNQDASYVPTPPVSPPVLFTNTVAGTPQLFYYSGDSAHSSNQYVISGSKGSTYLLGGIILKWFSSNTAGATSSPFVFNTLGINSFPNNAFQAFISFSNNPVLGGYTSLTKDGITITTPTSAVSNVSVFIIGN